MDIFHLSNGRITKLTDDVPELPAQGFLWLDAMQDEVAVDPAAWRDLVASITSVQIYDPHLADITNPVHPSYFDSTQDYAMVVFRKLALDGSNDDQERDTSEKKRRIPPALTKLATRPVTFLLMDHALVTIHAQSRTIEAIRNRLLEYKVRRDGGLSTSRAPATPEELLLRLLNTMVDQYLALRQPLTNQIDRWQRALLNPRSRFNNWTALLDARIELRKLDQLCEGQRDAMQELRDYLVDAQDVTGNSRAQDLILVRVNDVMEHITRVLNHAQRLETTIESAVQIHFSAIAHRTSDVMRILTVITALFMPLTLITGIFGMNFVDMPLLKDPDGFWISLGMMAMVVIALLFLFWRKRYLEDQILEDQ